MKYLLILFLVLVSFFSGAYWNEWKLLNSGPVKLSSTFELQSSAHEIGKLPKDTVLYPYSYKGETATFIVFINTKNLNLLEPVEFEHASTISPIEGFGG